MTKQEVAVIGGGLMGVGIAQVFATAGYAVSVYEPIQTVRDNVRACVRENLAALGLENTPAETIEVTDDIEKAVRNAFFVTEAVPEKLALKQAIFKELIKLAPRAAILASNTSVIPITWIADGLDTADRIVGTHWWNPAYLIPLVEVVQAQFTSRATVESTMKLLQSLGKKPAHVLQDRPGFVANRLQHALWREAIAMVSEGICDAETLDSCVKNSFGLRLSVLGPLENADLIGLDMTLDIHKTMMPELDCHNKPQAYLEAKVADGKLGFKSGEGFRKWSPLQIQTLRSDLVRHLSKARLERDAQ